MAEALGREGTDNSVGGRKADKDALSVEDSAGTVGIHEAGILVVGVPNPETEDGPGIGLGCSNLEHTQVHSIANAEDLVELAQASAQVLGLEQASWQPCLKALEAG